MEHTLTPTPEVFKLLAHDVRWQMLQLLARSDYSGQELVQHLHLPQNLISYHLKQLTTQQVVTERRNSADERSIYYRLDLDRLDQLYRTSALLLHPALSTWEPMPRAFEEIRASLPHLPVHVLFLCTHNSARSQMAEGIMREMSAGAITVRSAGSHPTPLHPLAIQACAAMGIDISQQRSKHVSELARQSFDYLITVCDRVREVCPTMPGDPEHIHWSFPDPAQVEGTDAEHFQAFEQTALQLMTRIRYFLILLQRERDAPPGGA